MQFLLNLTGLTYFLDGFNFLTTWQSSSSTAVPSSLLPTSVSKYEPLAMPSTGHWKVTNEASTLADLQVECTVDQERAITEARDLGRGVLKRVQGLPREVSSRESFGELSAADLRSLEKQYFGEDLQEPQRQSVRETFHNALEKWDHVQLICADFDGVVGAQGFDPKDSYEDNNFDVILIGRGFEALSKEDAVIALMHQFLRLIHDSALSGLEEFSAAGRNDICEADSMSPWQMRECRMALYSEKSALAQLDELAIYIVELYVGFTHGPGTPIFEGSPSPEEMAKEERKRSQVRDEL